MRAVTAAVVVTEDRVLGHMITTDWAGTTYGQAIDCPRPKTIRSEYDHIAGVALMPAADDMARIAGMGGGHGWYPISGRDDRAQIITFEYDS